MKYVLELCVTNDENGEALRDLYDEAIKRREDGDIDDHWYQDAGFDLYMPKYVEFQPWETQIVDLGVKCAAYRYDLSSTSSDGEEHIKRPTAFYIYPRSSICKTAFRMSNGTGIIDSGYRGNLKGAFDCAKPRVAHIDKYTRLLQICMPDLSPFKVRLVRRLNRTRRGGGGFGSTGS